MHDAAPAFAGLPEHDAAGRPVRVSMLGRAGCHLCDRARGVIVRVCDATGTGWVEADVDDHPELLPVFGELLPVVFVDGRRHDYWQVDPRRLGEALGSA